MTHRHTMGPCLASHAPKVQRRHLLLAPLLSMPLAQRASGASAAMPFQFGACVHLTLGRSTAAAVGRLLADSGLDTIREDVYWSRLERVQGEFQMPGENAELLQAVRLVHGAGGRPLLILSFGNRFYDNGGLVLSVEAISAFVRYTRFVVRHFAGLVDQFEVWNEWNTGFGSNPKVAWGDPVAYERLLRQVHLAIKQENPAATVVGGGVAGLDPKWVDAFFAAGGMDSLDVFSVHSYTLFRFKDHPEGAMHGLDNLRRRMQRSRPGREVPVFITEMGWPTNQGRHGVTETMAAHYLQRFMLMARSRPWIGGVWWYNLIDDGDSDTEMGQRFGLVRRDGSAKPAFAAAKQVMPWMRHSAQIQIQRLRAGGFAAMADFRTGPRAATWMVSPDAASWDEGMPDAPVARPDIEALAARTPVSGAPVFWERLGEVWVSAPAAPQPTGRL